MVASILFKKEFKQNAVIFIAPYLFLVLITILNRQNATWLPKQWVELLAVSLPLAMAGAYGLQAFDLEENGHTKDFLLTKPLSLRQIVWAKYATGLLILLPVTVLWIAVLLPHVLVAPNLDNVNSFWLTLFLLITVILYSASFLSGILIKGPVKLLAGIGIGIVAIGWSGLMWCEGLTALLYAQMDHFPGLALTLTYLFALLLIGFLLKISFAIIFRILKNTLSIKNNLKSISLALAVMILPPLLLWFGNSLNRPVVCAFNSLAHSISGVEEWFVALQGAQQPAGKLTAFTDGLGRLGIARPYQKPEPVYVNTDIEAKPLQNIAWSPDGRSIVFSENNQLKLYTMATKQTKELGAGAFGLWSRDSREIMIGKVADDPNSNSKSPNALRRISLSRLDLNQGTSSSVGELRSSNLSLSWDSQLNTLFSVNPAGILSILNLATGQHEQIGLLPAPTKEAVFYCKMLAPSPQSQIFSIIICSFPQSRPRHQRTYTIRWFDLNQQTKQITLTGILKNCTYKDLIGSATDHSLLVRSFDNGLYRRIKFSNQK